MELITRDLLYKNISIIVESGNQTQVVLTEPQIIEYINRAKTCLITHYNCTAGQKVFLSIDEWPEFFIWFFAGAELGLTFIVLDKSSQLAKENLEHFGNIDIVIDNQYLIYSYTDTTHKDVIWATPTSVLINTLSSGSTGTPKLIEYTHLFLASLAIRNCNVYNLDSNDICLHNKTLAHSSVVGIYFLPTLFGCRTHFYYTGFDDGWISFLKNRRINRCALFHNQLSQFVTEFTNDIDYNLTVFAIGKIPANTLASEQIQILTLFGCSETLGPIFISKDGTHFGKLLDDFYKVDITDGTLLVTCADVTINTGDAFCLENCEYVFLGRKHLYVIDDTVVNLEDTKSIVNKHLTVPYEIIPDFEYNTAYLLADEVIDLVELNAILKMHGFVQVTRHLKVDPTMFMNDIKFDANAVRKQCREHYDN